ncbi:MAG: zinc dependent phospholipase C family protein [SAR202 cluster bacterium]|nr:zinc dependent phospholipase C family protein [SAR202 cluster bacterium]
MPNLPEHIHLAHQAALRLRDTRLNEHMGSYLLGATAPDIRIITKRPREEYHFSPLEFEAVGAGAKGLFAAHPGLRALPKEDGITRAFVAGYLTHLVADEVWITQMYRPYFANRKLFPDETQGKVMDRALQLELDRQNREAIATAAPALSWPVDGVEIGFIGSDLLERWRVWVVGFMQHAYEWERLRNQARRIAAGDDGHAAHRLADDFIRGLPESLARLHEAVPPKEWATYQERTVRSLVETAGEYLG